MGKLEDAGELDLGKRAQELADEADELRGSRVSPTAEDADEPDTHKRLDDALKRLRELAG